MKNYKFINIMLFLICNVSVAFSQENIEKLIILGSGPAGLTSAIFAGQAGLNPLVIEGNECDGQLENVYFMENFPGFPEGINGEELRDRMRLQAEKFGAHFQSGVIVSVDLINRPFRFELSDGNFVYSEAVIIALGTSKRWLGLDSEELLKGKGVSGSASCDAHLFLGKKVVVFGGSDASLEDALTLAKHANKVTIVHRGDQLSASEYLQSKIRENENIEVILHAAVEEILDPSLDRVTAVVLKSLSTQQKRVLPCEGVFVSIGRQPNTALFNGQLEMNKSQLILVDSPQTNTSVPGVFAAGDVTDSVYRKAITAAGLGSMSALDAIRFLNQ